MQGGGLRRVPRQGHCIWAPDGTVPALQQLLQGLLPRSVARSASGTRRTLPVTQAVARCQRLVQRRSAGSELCLHRARGLCCSFQGVSALGSQLATILGLLQLLRQLPRDTCAAGVQQLLPLLQLRLCCLCNGELLTNSGELRGELLATSCQLSTLCADVLHLCSDAGTLLLHRYKLGLHGVAACRDLPLDALHVIAGLHDQAAECCCPLLGLVTQSWDQASRGKEGRLPVRLASHDVAGLPLTLQFQAQRAELLEALRLHFGRTQPLGPRAVWDFVRRRGDRAANGILHEHHSRVAELCEERVIGTSLRKVLAGANGANGLRWRPQPSDLNVPAADFFNASTIPTAVACPTRPNLAANGQLLGRGCLQRGSIAPAW
mmetsp:Transcript_118746/g.368946  ORF Transcript_118746/g.368946 Transcript_118746/m.368946 type:complete len:377 (-) Transcript_118746:754-1884(-)